MTMLTKLFAPHKLKPSSFPKPVASAPPPPPDDHRQITPLRIIHAGGFVECYYMAVPAVGIMEKYPRSILARPDVFRRPWDSLVRPEDILTPGEKFYVVPRGTVRKLQQRIRRSSVCHPAASGEKESESESDSSSKSSHRGMSVEAKATGISVAPACPPRRKRMQFAEMWQPSLVAIDESSPLMAPPLPPPSEILS